MPRPTLASFARLGLLLGLLTAAQLGCGGNPDTPSTECTDGTDNDHDGLVDQEDPACIAGNEHESDDPVRQCNDTADNDGDGKIDFPEDPGCESSQDDDEIDFGTAQCDDGMDNDGDGFTDYPDDPGCFSTLQNDETDDCPDGPNCPQCANHQDDDGDGSTDFPDDPGCTAASDNQEQSANPAACTGQTFEQLPQDGLVYSTLGSGNQSNLVSNTCGGTGVEKIYEFYVETPSVMVATTDLAATVIDTVIYVRSDCNDTATEAGCNDNASADTTKSTLSAVLQPGYYYLVIDGKTASTFGAFQLRVQFFPGVGDPCDPTNPDACAPGLVCRTVPGNSGPTCEAPVCSDGRDDDGDGTPDYPGDPGCSSPGDATEDDTCPDGADCPQCANGLDDDNDGQTDYPADTGCLSASQPIEGCGTEQDPINNVTASPTPGDTTSSHDDQSPPSGCSFGSGGPDNLYVFSLPVPVNSLQVDTAGGFTDTVVYLEDGSCAGNFYGCDDDSGGSFTSLFTTGPLAAGTYAVVVDSYCSTCTGTYNLHLHGEVPGGAACTDPMFASGILACETGSTCNGSICVPPQCSNGSDDDGDGIADYPNDPGCTDAIDNDETDSCPGAGCPQCANTVDDDGDLAIDFPADLNCVAAGDATEGCEQDVTQLVNAPYLTGTTVGAHMDFGSVCAWNAEAAPDRTYALVLPVPASSLTIDTVGSNFDTVLSIKTPACDTSELYCDDNGGGVGLTSRVALSNLAAGNYIIDVDGYNGASGNYALNIHGIVNPGASCTSPLFAQGVLSCAIGQTCVSGTCQ